MKVNFSEECKELLRRLELSQDLVTFVFNNRTRGMITKAKPPQIYAVSWLKNGRIIFVNGTVTKYELEESRLHIQEVSVNLALELKEKLPAGNINKEMSAEEMLGVVAESFGMPVVCHPDELAVKFYNGRWDGKQIKFQIDNTDLYRISGSFSPQKRTCNYVWVFSFNLYKNWFILS